jgi:uncharacterized membrane protein
MKRTVFFALSILAAASQTGCSDDKPPTYQANIKPILDTHCVACHVPGGSGYEQSGLRLDSYDALMKGTRLNPVVHPGSSLSSTLYRMVSGQLDASIRMPHNEAKLTEENVSMIGAWIDQGAKN